MMWTLECRVFECSEWLKGMHVLTSFELWFWFLALFQITSYIFNYLRDVIEFVLGDVSFQIVLGECIAKAKWVIPKSIHMLSVKSIYSNTVESCRNKKQTASFVSIRILKTLKVFPCHSSVPNSIVNNSNQNIMFLN